MTNNDIVPGFDKKRDKKLTICLQEIKEVPHCLLLRLSGFVDKRNRALFEKRISKVIDAGFVRLIFDLGEFGFVSDDGLGCLTYCYKQVQLKGGDMVLFKIHPKAYEIFQLLGFSTFFIIRDNLEEAIDFFMLRQ